MLHALADAAIEIEDFFLVERVGERQHRDAVFDRRELGGRRRADPLRRGRRYDEFGPRSFQLQQLAVQPVVLRVTDLRIVFDVIVIIVLVNQLAQGGRPLAAALRHSHPQAA